MTNNINNFTNFNASFLSPEEIYFSFSDVYGTIYSSLIYIVDAEENENKYCTGELHYEIICTDPFSTYHSNAEGLAIRIPEHFIKDNSNEELIQFLRQVIRLYTYTFFSNAESPLNSITSSMDDAIHSMADAIKERI